MSTALTMFDPKGNLPAHIAFCFISVFLLPSIEIVHCLPIGDKLGTLALFSILLPALLK